MMKVTLKSKSLAFALLAAVTLAACGSSTATIEDVRSSFVKAGGKCTSETPNTTTTVESPEEEKEFVWRSVQFLDCGDKESSISTYKSPEEAKRATYLMDAFKAAFMISTGSEVYATRSIFTGDAVVALEVDSYSDSEAMEIADKMGADLYLGSDTNSRNKMFDEVIKETENGGLTLTANGCLADKLLSVDGKSASFDTKGEEDSEGDLLASAYCMLRALLAPDYIFDSMAKTRALDGLMEESWSDFRVNWRYHPNTGVQLTIIHKI
jgi:hypothetical protein